jgi:hypothetical protein
LVPNSEYELYDHLSKPDQATSSAAARAAKAAAVTIGAIMVAVVGKEKMLDKKRDAADQWLEKRPMGL